MNLKVLNNKELEIRPAYFLKFFNRTVENMAIISFGKCNFNCLYCKRNGQFKNKEGNIIRSVSINWNDLKDLIDNAILKGQRIRLSGGDPCMFYKESLYIAKYVWEKYNQKISIAHNGSNFKFVENLLPYLDYVAIDLKSDNNDDFNTIAGIKNGKKIIDTSLKIQKFCSENDILVDIRTCIFKDTSLEQMLKIAKLITKDNNIDNIVWTIRRYNTVEGCNFKSPSIEETKNKIKIIKSKYPNLKIGMRNEWEGGFNYY
ncbi:Radical SAM domain-containing protein (plasmid) [Clostridium botulinum Af84]|uniref:radical SAM protein n=1 Tax=Clostridium botulinum TaxID=1491 RepID=UPI00035BA1F7|nr:radical SAM protein [Clostridium botulinum]APR02725.1 radical SAM superfamily protein [Clostridium botulinum]AUN19729.1 hypothetical protein B2M06_19435 [Clostridium botulinum]EPS54337.1 Radical SAM domain-containing protein [Clostridium botulinum Af84]NFM82271.1 radical SAM protein [Clostridium botulinum]NFP09962.1 radical SAM protein [Clostridium botulinum]